MTDEIRCDYKTQIVTNHANEMSQCHEIKCCGIRLQVVVNRDESSGSRQKFTIKVETIYTWCERFHFALEVYPIPLDNDNIPLRDETNYLYYATTEKVRMYSLMAGLLTGATENISDHDLYSGYLSDPANGFADAEGNFDLSIMFAVNFDEPIEPESCYVAK